MATKRYEGENIALILEQQEEDERVRGREAIKELEKLKKPVNKAARDLSNIADLVDLVYDEQQSLEVPVRLVRPMRRLRS
jgi:hypothetical protein